MSRVVSPICGVVLAFAVLPAYGGLRRGPAEAPPRLSTYWHVSPSLKYDALCFVNVLTGDPFYLKYYGEEYAQFEPKLTPAARAALAGLKRRLKDENKNIISAFLSLHFSAAEGETLDDMLLALGNDAAMKRSLKRTPYYDERGWRLFEAARGDLLAVLLFMKEAGFEAYWRQHILPKVGRRAAEIEEGLARYDVAAEVERATGAALPSNRINVYLLNFTHPHGIRLTGTRFLADARWPLGVVLQNAVHEMLHPPYDLSRDRELRQALGLLRKDTFLMGKVENHDPSFGYNSFESFVEEDCVRALEQVVRERLGVAGEPHRRWREEDEGIHVFAVALYGLMKRENFGARGETFRDFLVGAIRSGKLGPGSIKPASDAFFRDEGRPR